MQYCLRQGRESLTCSGSHSTPIRALLSSLRVHVLAPVRMAAPREEADQMASLGTHWHDLSHLIVNFKKLFRSRLLNECEYCCEEKPMRAFAINRMLPARCRVHLKDVCKTCVRASLLAQIDSRPILEVSCPQCHDHWSVYSLRRIFGRKDRKRIQELDLLSQSLGFVPAAVDMPDEFTMELMLSQGARLCPWCQFPFIKIGGCESMICELCLAVVRRPCS